MPVPWSKVEDYFATAFELSGRIERQDVIELAFAENESDDVVDAIDFIGSRSFPSVDDVKSFLLTNHQITD